MDQEIARLKELTEKSRAMVFFGGAGAVSYTHLIPAWKSRSSGLTAAPAAATF